MTEKLTYSIPEAVRAIGVGRTTVYRLLDSGELESIKVGRRRLIPTAAIRAYLHTEQARQNPTEADDAGTPLDAA